MAKTVTAVRAPGYPCSRISRSNRIAPSIGHVIQPRADGFAEQRVIEQWTEFYNQVRPDSAPKGHPTGVGRTPAEAYRGVAAPGQRVA